MYFFILYQRTLDKKLYDVLTTKIIKAQEYSIKLITIFLNMIISMMFLNFCFIKQKMI